jgi:Zn-finger nucleic acid-binding protein
MAAGTTPDVAPLAMDLTCPKCHGTMRTYERNGVHVDQCGECRGIFLDRGELDRLIDAENQWHGAGKPRPTRHDDDRDEYRDEHRREQHQSGGLGSVVGEVLSQVRSSQHGSRQGQYGYGHKPRKKESFLSDLFG